MAAVLRSKEVAARMKKRWQLCADAAGTTDSENDAGGNASPHRGTLPQERSLPESRMGGHRAYFDCAGGPLFWCPEGTIENSPAFQRWVGRRKTASPEGTPELHNPSFSRPFGTCVSCPMFPGVKTPGYSQDVPPGPRNQVAAFAAKKAPPFTRDDLKAISRLRCPARKIWDMPTVCGEKKWDMFNPKRGRLMETHVHD